MTFRFIILAAGKGSRMKQDLPKALTPIGGKPILQYLYESIQATGLDPDPIVVIGPERVPLCETFGGSCHYVVQEKQLGTGHAVAVTQEAVGSADAVMVLYGDHPFITSESLLKLTQRHQDRGNVVTMMTTHLQDFEGWRKAFLYWSRIVRGEDGHIVRDVQYKDATEEDKKITEVNPCLYCFDANWLWKNITFLKNENAQQEYYLTDLIALAVEQGQTLSSIEVAPEEVIGINTQDERDIAEALLAKRYEST
ncbi:hypothetical protein COV05_02150 [Candidatus Uhrbacteria bacterium CG10_big_fil_rev_8_21_14_0_10_48_16]|uniref:MobA-like NTP transferase domain-containing protein n=1 Tax=Candidatus Uhrbacteria bacterium CG10_big_fil_rev_8_21_14_0_10_48_16 TaxID=1975038 RepID=A0A2M8LHQ5_9BACT|nr:MAG: hypothetical protein COV05_02150 [Candidatus Uhrbacteria bacterium CG10_big_fil_rev_8_21_14_0_10_48_16]